MIPVNTLSLSAKQRKKIMIPVNTLSLSAKQRKKNKCYIKKYDISCIIINLWKWISYIIDFCLCHEH